MMTFEDLKNCTKFITAVNRFVSRALGFCGTRALAADGFIHRAEGAGVMKDKKKTTRAVKRDNKPSELLMECPAYT